MDSHKLIKEENMPRTAVSLTALVCAFVLARTPDFFLAYFAGAHWKTSIMLAVLFITFTIHEFIHGTAALICGAHPRFGFRYIFFYTAFDEFVTRNSYLTIAVAPLVIFDIILLTAFAALPAARAYVYFAFIINTAGSIGDLWIAVSILKHDRECLIKDTPKGYSVYFAGESL
jgi:hypothetical protein